MPKTNVTSGEEINRCVILTRSGRFTVTELCEQLNEAARPAANIWSAAPHSVWRACSRAATDRTTRRSAPTKPRRTAPVHPHPALLAPKRQAAPRFAPAPTLSVAAVPRPKSPASFEPAALSKSSHWRLTHPAPTKPLPDPIPLKIQFPSSQQLWLPSFQQHDRRE